MRKNKSRQQIRKHNVRLMRLNPLDSAVLDRLIHRSQSATSKRPQTLEIILGRRSDILSTGEMDWTFSITEHYKGVGFRK